MKHYYIIAFTDKFKGPIVRYPVHCKKRDAENMFKEYCIIAISRISKRLYKEIKK